MEIIINTADSTAIYEKALSIGLFYISPSPNYTKYSFCIVDTSEVAGLETKT